MTERQAWLKLVKAAQAGEFLCNAIYRDYAELADKLLAPIRRKLRRRFGGGLALWDIDPEGRKARAAFCRAQVARIDARARARKSSTRSR